MLKSRGFLIFSYSLLGLLSIMMIVPLINVIATSFSTGLGSMQPSVIFWPDKFTFEAYEVLWRRLEYWRPLMNTIFVTSVGSIIHVFLSAIGGYVLAQSSLPGKNLIAIIILLTLTIPSQIIMVPLFVVFKQFHLLNTLTSLIVAELVSGFSILLMKTYFERIPIELKESAKIDGANTWMIFLKIYVPLTFPGLATVLLFDVVRKYNMFIEPLIFINDPLKMTLQVALKSIVLNDQVTSTNDIITPNVVSAGIVLALAPLILFYPAIQRYFITGIYSGAVKE
ncbi:MAG TPA: carbohydrate ABC transporter permease [Candidatus Marinimicrobia bacterium]|nr:carbohydrate ABC transporter permease [Candidatus Neomarinimicrobiota bacterium]